MFLSRFSLFLVIYPLLLLLCRAGISPWLTSQPSGHIIITCFTELPGCLCSSTCTLVVDDTIHDHGREWPQKIIAKLQQQRVLIFIFVHFFFLWRQQIITLSCPSTHRRQQREDVPMDDGYCLSRDSPQQQRENEEKARRDLTEWLTGLTYETGRGFTEPQNHIHKLDRRAGELRWEGSDAVWEDIWDGMRWTREETPKMQVFQFSVNRDLGLNWIPMIDLLGEFAEGDKGAHDRSITGRWGRVSITREGLMRNKMQERG